MVFGVSRRLRRTAWTGSILISLLGLSTWAADPFAGIYQMRLVEKASETGTPKPVELQVFADMPFRYRIRVMGPNQVAVDLVNAQVVQSLMGPDGKLSVASEGTPLFDWARVLPPPKESPISATLLISGKGLGQRSVTLLRQDPSLWQAPPVETTETTPPEPVASKILEEPAPPPTPVIATEKKPKPAPIVHKITKSFSSNLATSTPVPSNPTSLKSESSKTQPQKASGRLTLSPPPDTLVENSTPASNATEPTLAVASAVSSRVQPSLEERLVSKPQGEFPPSDAVKALIQKAGTAYDRGKFSEAQSLVESALRLDPANPTLWAALGEIRLKQGALRPALANYEKAVLGNPEAYAQRYVQLLIRAGQPELSFDLLNRLVQEHPQAASFHQLLGELYQQTGDSELALFHLEKAAKLDPNSADNQYLLGLAYELSGNLRNALTHYAEATRLDPQHPDAARALSRVKQ